MNVSPVNYQPMNVKNIKRQENSVNFKGAEKVVTGVIPAATLAAMAGVKAKQNTDKFSDYNKIYDENGKLIRQEKTYTQLVDADPKCCTGRTDDYYVTKKNVITYCDNGNTIESYNDDYVIRETDNNGKVVMLKEGSSPALLYDKEGNPIKPYPEFDVNKFEKRINYLVGLYK